MVTLHHSDHHAKHHVPYPLHYQMFIRLILYLKKDNLRECINTATTKIALGHPVAGLTYACTPTGQFSIANEMNNPSQDQTLMLPSTSSADMNLITENQELKAENALLKKRIDELEKFIPRRSKRLRVESLESEDEL